MPNNANGTITRLDIVVSNDSFASLCSGAAEVVSLVKNWKRDLIDFEVSIFGCAGFIILSIVTFCFPFQFIIFIFIIQLADLPRPGLAKIPLLFPGIT